MERKARKKIVLVLNSTPLIYLSKAGLIRKLVTIASIIITNSVYREVVIEGRKVGAPEVDVVESLINSREVEIRGDPTNTKLVAETYKLGLGESSAILLALNEECIAIIDDERARRTGKILGVAIHGTMFVLKLMLLQGIIKVKEIKDSIEKMIREGFRISPEVLIGFIRDIEQEANP